MRILQRARSPYGQHAAGMALLLTVFTLLAAATMIALVMNLTLSASRDAKTTKYGNQAHYLAEAAIEAAKQDLATAIANWHPAPQQGTASVAAIQVPWTAVPTGFSQVITDPAGIQQIVTGFQLEARAGINGHERVVRRIVNTEATPIFQFAVFYNGDLEINPGPSMTLSGRVHSNSNAYLNSGATLTLDTNYLRAVGGMYRHRKDDPNLSEGTVRVRQWVQNPFSAAEPTSFVTMNSVAQMASAGVPGGVAYESSFTSGWDANGNGLYSDVGDYLPWALGAQDYWSEPDGYSAGSGHTVRDQAHGTQEAVVPDVNSTSMFEPNSSGSYYFDVARQEYLPAAPGMGTHDKGYFHSEAGLTILAKPDGTVQGYDGQGNSVGLGSTGTAIVEMYDARQGGKVKVVKLDLEQLAASGHFPANGLIYAGFYGTGTGSQAKGVSLTRGSQLAAKLTVVSENSVYIQGDYNTVSKKPAAVIADSVNLLSNAWNNTKTSLTLPVASNTTYNVAMITGNQETKVGAYNGGLENLPRFHENWTNKTCTIKGSFINMWESRYATAGWVYGGVKYTAPTRVWSYDSAFNSVGNLPPHTPMVVTARDVAVW